MYNTYCFSIATMVARTHFNDTLYVHYLFGLNFKTGDASNNRPFITVQTHRRKNLHLSRHGHNCNNHFHLIWVRNLVAYQ